MSNLIFENPAEAKAWLDGLLSNQSTLDKNIEVKFSVSGCLFAVLLPSKIAITYEKLCQVNGFGLFGNKVYCQFQIASLSQNPEAANLAYDIANHLLKTYKGCIIDNSRIGTSIIRRGDINYCMEPPKWTDGFLP